jgi:HEPN domain-containing protein/predicted nucleotidyltransferase
MIQRAQPTDPVVAEIAGRIRTAVQPWRVVLFGSRARGNAGLDSDYDIYVEVDAERSTLKEVDRQIRALLAGLGSRRIQLDLKVRTRGEIERRREDPGTIEWNVAREGKVVYADPGASTVLMPTRRVREPSTDSPPSMHEWLEAAERDLRHCQDLRKMARDYSPEICWLSHQTCERHLEALLVARQVRPKRTHRLNDLLSALRSVGCALKDLDADCELLTTHAVTPRYPAGLDLGPENAEAAFAAAERVIAAVRAELPPRLH